MSKSLSPFAVRRVYCDRPIVQGGMGVGVSLAELAGAVAREGGMGTVSSACLDRLVSRRLGRDVGAREAAAAEIARAKALSEGRGAVAMNVMVAIQESYAESVLGALDGGADAIVSGAGLPLSLPSVVAGHPRAEDVALIPIVSSARALRVLGKRWAAAGRRPDAVVVEGPMAGGHLGWKSRDEVEDPAHSLENLVDEVLAEAERQGGIPVIAAGGIYDHEDVAAMLRRGAAAVQLGTRFLATQESGASEAYKRAVVASTLQDIEVAVAPGSPCGLPFRVLRSSSMYRKAVSGVLRVRCDKGYLRGPAGCLAVREQGKYFCICNGLLSSAGYNPDEEAPLYTVGANAWRVDRVVPVRELMAELSGETPATLARAANA
ncbi:NAD(P)H-dependent flavin oxidoreductase [Deferrisoma palaeochoriense]